MAASARPASRRFMSLSKLGMAQAGRLQTSGRSYVRLQAVFLSIRGALMTIPPLHGSLAGRTAIVTGSGRNIGRAVALSLAAQGARVVVNGHSDRAAVDGVVDEIRAAGGQAHGVMA